MLRLLCIFFFLWLQSAGLAQARVMNDTAPVAVRNFSPGTINAFRAEPEFQYERFTEPPKSLWNRFWDWFWQKVFELLGTGNRMEAFKFIVIAAAIAVLAFFLMKLAGMTNVGLFGKANKETALHYTTLSEDIHAIPFDTAIRQAVEEGNYRYAVRLLYLQSLKHLADRALIHWQINKTNEAYLYDLAGTSLQHPFRSLTLRFENNWYGNLPIAENEFGKVRDQFIQFNQQLP